SGGIVLAESELRLRSENARNALTQLEQRARRAELEVKHLKELLRLERIAKYGPASERLSDAQMQLLESESGVQVREVEKEADQSETDKQVPAEPRQPKVNRRGEQSLPAHLTRQERV